MHDLRHAVRSLMKSPGFTAIALLTLALGIGANTAIFSLVKSVLLRPLPYPHPEQIVALWEDQRSFDHAPLAWPTLLDWQRENRSFSALAGYRRVNYALTGVDEPEQLASAQVSAAFFPVIGLAPQLGRVFTAEEDRGGAAGLVVLSSSFWRRHFGGDPTVLGRTLILNEETFTVIGVLPPEFATPADVDFYTQLGRPGGYAIWDNRALRPGIFVLGRMKPGVTFKEAIADLKNVAAQIEQAHPATNTGVTASGQLLFDQTVGGYRQGLWLLLGAVALVLLIACANLANLFLARGSAREAEFAVRAALGASQRKIMGQLMLENLLLAFVGGGLGLLVALWAQRGIAALSPAGVARFQEAGIDGEVLAATGGISLLAVLLFGLWPAWKAGQVDLRSAMQAGGRTGSAGTSATRARETLIVAEIALTLVLLVGAGLLMKSFARAQAVNLGFDARGVVTARVALPWLNYNTPEKVRLFNDRLLASLAAAHSLKAADIAFVPPLAPSSENHAGYFIEGEPAPPPGQVPLVELNSVSDGYFRTLGIPILRGRTFGPEDTATGVRSLIIDQAFSDRHWLGKNAIGQHVRPGGPSGDLYTIIGIVPTIRSGGYAVEPRLPQAYLSSRQNATPRFTVLVRGEGNPAALAAIVRRAVKEIDPKQPVSDVYTLEDRIDANFATPRLYTFLLSIFAGLALLLAAIGLCGVLAYQVNRRTREFGIRLALGAMTSQVRALVLRRGLRLTAIGLGLGLLGALALGRALSSLLFQTNPIDLGVIGSVTVLLAVVALLASWLPARRATKVDPMIALRSE